MNKNDVEFVCSFLVNECSSLFWILNFKTPTNEKFNVDILVDWSVNNNFENLCLFLLETYKNIETLIFFRRYAKKGFERTCRLIEKLGYVKKRENDMLVYAAKGGHENLCRIAKDEWGANDFDGMLAYATHGGHENLCRLAKEWGANDFIWMLTNAAWTGNKNLCILAKEWGANNFFAMLGIAKDESLKELALEWSNETK